MAKKETITVKGAEIVLFKREQEDYISLTDIAKYKDARTEVVIQNWIRSRMTIELLGFWEILHNPSFKHIEFDVFRSQAVLINDNVPQRDRLVKLNRIAIQQIRVLQDNENRKYVK